MTIEKPETFLEAFENFNRAVYALKRSIKIGFLRDLVRIRRAWRRAIL